MKISTIDASHLIGLNTREALMLVRLLQAARFHQPTATELQIAGDCKGFLKELSDALLRAITAAPEQGLPCQTSRIGSDRT